MITRRQRSSQLWMINDPGGNDSFKPSLLTKTYYPQQKSQASLYLIHDHLQNFHSVHASQLRFRTQILGADAIFKPWIIAESPRTLISRQLTSQSTIINQTGCRAENRRESSSGRAAHYAAAWSLVVSGTGWPGLYWDISLHWPGILLVLANDPFFLFFVAVLSDTPQRFSETPQNTAREY